MRKVILNLAVKLDGFIEGPNGEIDWCIADSAEMGEGSAFDKFLSGIDTIFYGRVSYDMWGEYQPGPDASAFEKNLWGTVHSKKKYVFSKDPAPPYSHMSFPGCDIPSSVNEIKSQPGKDIWLYGGAGIITTFINMGLVDSYLLAVHPVILGAGKPLFSNIQHRVGLSLDNITSSKSGVVLIEYSRKRDA